MAEVNGVLPYRQARVLNYVTRFIGEHGYAPTIRQIGDAVNLSSSSTVDYNLRQLEEKGYLVRTRGRQALALTRPVPAVPDPFLVAKVEMAEARAGEMEARYDRLTLTLRDRMAELEALREKASLSPRDVGQFTGRVLAAWDKEFGAPLDPATDHQMAVLAVEAVLGGLQ